jgi:hypothetical protein
MVKFNLIAEGMLLCLIKWIGNGSIADWLTDKCSLRE